MRGTDRFIAISGACIALAIAVVCILAHRADKQDAYPGLLYIGLFSGFMLAFATVGYFFRRRQVLEAEDSNYTGAYVLLMCAALVCLLTQTPTSGRNGSLTQSFKEHYYAFIAPFSPALWSLGAATILLAGGVMLAERSASSVESRCSARQLSR